jgi:hypothetical protein
MTGNGIHCEDLRFTRWRRCQKLKQRQEKNSGRLFGPHPRHHRQLSFGQPYKAGLPDVSWYNIPKRRKYTK